MKKIFNLLCLQRSVILSPDVLSGRRISFLRFLVSLGMTIWVVIFVLIFPYSIVYAGSENRGTTTATFLKIGVGARPAGMGGTFVAIADDINALYWNPAGLAQITRNEFSATYIQWFEGINMQYLGYVFPLKNKSALAASITYLSANDIEKRDDTGKLLGEIKNYHLSLPVAYSLKINPFLALGGTVKFISQVYDSDKGNTLVADFGALLTPIKNLNFGVCLQNIGSELKTGGKKNKLPTTLKTGLAFRIPNIKSAIVSLDYDFPTDNEPKLHSGIEYTFKDNFYLRAGYEQMKDLSKNAGLTLGLGFVTYWTKEETTWGKTGTEGAVKIVIDYALVSYGEFGYTHRFSLGMKF